MPSYFSKFLTKTLIGLTQTLQCGLFSIDPAQTALHHRHFFYTDGNYTAAAGLPEPFSGTWMQHQMYVERLNPICPSLNKPSIVLVHGGGQTGTNWINTPDGRPGWASFFLNKGYTVYIVDQIHTGRSVALSTMQPNLFHVPAEFVVGLFSAPKDLSPLPWPQAALHTQWPSDGINDAIDKGKPGDAVFDQFYASQHRWNIDQSEQEPLVGGALISLINNIEGKVVLIGHSQGAGPIYKAANLLGGTKLKGLISMEPIGSVFEDYSVFDYPLPRPYQRKYGLTESELIYDPPVTDPLADLFFPKVRVGVDTPERASCLQQAEPARELVGIRDIKTLVVTSDAGWNAKWDHCTVNYLRQAGVDADHLRFEEVGISGNGHMFFLEKNNYDSFREVEKWIKEL